MGKKNLAPGARQLPLHHISIRVPWHDRGWDGAICDDPKSNTSCLILRRVAEVKDDEGEHVSRAKFWKDLSEASFPAVLQSAAQSWPRSSSRARWSIRTSS